MNDEAPGRGRWLVLLLTALLALLAAWWAVGVGIEPDNESLDTRDAADLARQAEFRLQFGADEDLLVGIGHPELSSGPGLEVLKEVTAALRNLEGVRQVWSLATIDEIVAGPFGPDPRPIWGPEEAAGDVATRLPDVLRRNPSLAGWLVSQDLRAAGILVELEDRSSDPTVRRRLLAAIRALAPSVAARGGELHLTGVPVQKSDVAELVDRDQRRLLPLAVVALGVVLAFFFRHPAGVVVPLGVAGLTVMGTVGSLAASGHALNAITSLLPPVLLVVAVAGSVHLVEAWQRGAGSEAGTGDPAARTLAARRRILLPATLCAVTTAQGFGSLLWGELPAVRQFGFFAAFGTLLAFGLTMTSAVAALSLFRVPSDRRGDLHPWLGGLVDRTALLAIRRPGGVLVVFLIVTLALAAGLPRLRSNTDLLTFLLPSAPLRQDTTWIESHLGASQTIDFVLQRRGDAELGEVERLRRLERLEESVKALPGVAGVTSLATLVTQVRRAQLRPAGAERPGDEEELAEAIDLLLESGHGLVRRHASADLERLRLQVRLRAAGSAEILPLVAKIRVLAASVLGPELEFRPIGALWQMLHDSDRLVSWQVRSFGLAIVLIVAAIGLLLRSWRFTLVAMLPNVLPILWTLGFMGWLRIDLSSGTVMIASAVLGIVVDDTIHYLVHYRRVLASTDPVSAVRATSRAVGAPVSVTSVALVLGFWVGAFGSFLPTVHFSLLSGLAMLAGAACDLLLLPAVLILMDHGRPRPAPSGDLPGNHPSR